ncbi:hypothetical protein ACQVP2_34750 [Methylobacterium aquaticum]|uniref:hypothetical protein n=1 Tax=Methylobacterium aquaticum TaxID=270351 RepID=UPI003D16A8F6
MNNVNDADLIEAAIGVCERLSDDEHSEMVRLGQEQRDTQIRLDMVEEIECELVMALGKRARHDQELRNVLDLVDATAKVLRTDLRATNEAIGKIIKGVIDHTLAARSNQNQ